MRPAANKNSDGRVGKLCRLNKNRNQNAWKTLKLCCWKLLGSSAQQEIDRYLKDIRKSDQLNVSDESDLTFELG